MSGDIDKALEAFSRARELVPGNSLYVMHPLTQAYRVGDTETVRELTSGDFALPVPSGVTDWLNRALLGDPADFDPTTSLDDLQELGADSAAVGPFLSLFTYSVPSRWPLAREALERSHATGDFRDCSTQRGSLNAGQLAWYHAEAAASDDATRLECLMALHVYGLPMSAPALESLSRTLPERWESAYLAAAAGDGGPLATRLAAHRDSASMAGAAGDSTQVLWYEGQVLLGEAYGHLPGRRADGGRSERAAADLRPAGLYEGPLRPGTDLHRDG